MTADIRALADAVEAEDFYALEDGRRTKVSIDWPWTLARATIAFLDGARTPFDRQTLTNIAKRVRGRDWCTLWQDPGDPTAFGGRLPDRVDADERPGELATAALALVEDFEDAEAGA